MTTERAAARPARPAGSAGTSRPWKAWIVAGLATVYAVTFYVVTEPVAPRSRAAVEPAPRERATGATRPASLSERPRPSAAEPPRGRPGRVRTRSS